MITTSLTRTNNSIRADLPNAVAIIKNMQAQNNRISFEAWFYADAEAYEMISNPNSISDAINLENNGIVARKHYSEESSIIESHLDVDDEGSLLAKLEQCCYRWLTEKLAE